MKILNVNKEGKNVPVTVFMAGKDAKVYYSIGLSKKVGDKYEYGYINAVFNKDIVLSNKDKIIIEEASLDFYKKENQTIPFIRVWKFEKVEDKKEETFEDLENPFDLPF